MRDNIRKYKLNLCETIAHGIGISGTSKQTNILDPFTIECDGTILNYPSITLNTLSTLPNLEYKKRISDHLCFLNIQNETIKQNILTGATSFDPECIEDCSLNEEFLVYRFLDGVRVVDIGTTLGEAQYKAYPQGDDPNNYSWQTSATFLNLDLSETYVFQIRDYFLNEEICVVEKIISLPNLVQSTTIIPEDKTISIFQINDGCSSSLCYNTGCVKVQDPLVGGECLKVSFEIGTDTIGDGFSCAVISRKPSGVSNFTTVCCIDNTGASPKTGHVYMFPNDIVCYNLNVSSPSLGSCGCSYLCLTNVSGLGTTNPTISSSNKEKFIYNEVPRPTICVETARTTDTITTTTCTQNGEILFTPIIPTGENVTLCICGRADSTIDGNSGFEILCKAAGSSIFNKVIEHTDNNSQPFDGSIIIENGDELTYKLNTEVNSAGSTATSYWGIYDTTSSFGVNTQINSPTGDCITQSVSNINYTVSVCKQTSPIGCMNGYINVEKTNTPGSGLNSGDYVDLTTTKSVIYDGDATATLEISCKANGDSSFVPIIVSAGCCDTLSPITCDTFRINAGDVICYQGNAEALTFGSTASAAFTLHNVIGGGAATPTINLNKNSDSTLSETVVNTVCVKTARTTDSSTSTSCIQNGEFIFESPTTPAIPNGSCVTLFISGRADATIDGTSSFEILCNGVKIFDHLHTNSQPFDNSVEVLSGDDLTYKLITCADTDTSTASSSLGIYNAFGCNNINTQINSPTGDSVNISYFTEDYTVSVCNQCTTDTYINGFINVEKTGTPGSSLDSGHYVDISTLKRVVYTGDGITTGILEIYRKPNGQTTFVPIVSSIACLDTGEPMTSDCFRINAGDCVCYMGCATADSPGTEVTVYFCLDSAIGGGGAISTLNSQAIKRYDVVNDTNLADSTEESGGF